MQGKARQFGVREYQRLLHGAGLSPAIAHVLSLEQGQTDKLCELSPKDLLELVFQVFGDKEVLDRYQEARHHQEAHRARTGRTGGPGRPPGTQDQEPLSRRDNYQTVR